jgi:uncharacterized protein YndB with AHSA1/START domain/DNA-binding transcriptional ArsR family regulator
MIAQKPLNVNSVAGNFAVSRTAIYKHVKILTECGLIVVKQHGRERYYEAKLQKLNEITYWIEQHRKFWNANWIPSKHIWINYRLKIKTLLKIKNMLKESKIQETGSDKELFITRLINAPRELVWKVWTEPEHVAQWWGPTGFTNTVHEMNVKPGGVWHLTMHGPDGRDYPNKIVFIEVVKPERLVYKHSGDVDAEPVNFHVTVSFEKQGNKTLLTMRSVFESAAALEKVVKEYGAKEGMVQHVDRLEEYVEKISI